MTGFANILQDGLWADAREVGAQRIPDGITLERELKKEQLALKYDIIRLHKRTVQSVGDFFFAAAS